ncbi:bacteriohemerythrin [Hydrogenimonas sp.]
MIEKNRLPQVAKPEMNAMHDEEADIVNMLLSAVDNGDDKTVTQALEELLAHMQKHFDFEEDMLRNRGFGMFDIHRNDHSRIMGETRMAYMNWRNFRDREALRDFIEDDFIEWLNLHIQAMDSVAADFLMLHGEKR